MIPPPLVLDTNVYSYAKLDELKRLFARGLRLRVSDVALQEALAASVREYRSGMPLKRARGKFFARARSVAPYIDSANPIALTGSAAIGAIRALVDGLAVDPDDIAYGRRMLQLWQQSIGPGMHDKEWVINGDSAQRFLDTRDERLIALARTEKAIRAGKLPARYAAWDTLSEDERFAAIFEHVRRSSEGSDAAVERLDAFNRSFAWRLHVARKGARMPKDNDGADLVLTQHIGDGCVLVTNERHLVAIIDQCGTHQAPWVRKLDDLDALPTGEPWGENARNVHHSFRRKG